MNNRMIAGLLALCFLLGLMPLAQAQTPTKAQLQCGRVDRVIDGDTIEIIRAGERIRIRLWGVDAPERYWPEGKAATKYLNCLILGRRVCIKQVDIGPYGRPVAIVFLDTPDGDDLALELLQKGLARWVKSRAPKAKNYQAAQAQARAARRGIWGLCEQGDCK